MPRSRKLLFMILDMICLTVALGGAVLLRFEELDPRLLDYFTTLLPATAPLGIMIFHFFGLYKRAVRYASIPDLVAIFSSVTLLTMAKMVFVFFYHAINYSRAVLVVDWLLGLTFIGMTRLLPRVLLHLAELEPFRSLVFGHKRGTLRRVLIYGAGRAGETVVREMRRNDNLRYHIVGLIDDSRRKIGQIIHGCEVLGTRAQLPHIVQRKRIDEVIIAMPSAPGEAIREIVRICRNTQVRFKTLPGMSDLLQGKLLRLQLRDIQVEDLLRRPSAEVDLAEIAAYVTGKTVLVTGAGGSIGSEICRQLIPFKPKRLLLLGQGENSIFQIQNELEEMPEATTIERVSIIADIKDETRIRQVFDRFKPQIIFHAAAHKHVPLMETNPEEAVKNNILGTRNLVCAADEGGVERFVMISTDKAVNPTSVMGATKRVAEMIMKAMAKRSKTRFCAVRFGNVLGSRGSVIPLFKRQIERGGPITITHPQMVRYFMTIPEASQLTIQAGAYGKGGEVFLLDMGEPVKIADLAGDLIRLAGLEEGKDIQIEYTGIRPGEKLYEELLTAEEGVTATQNKKIFTARPEEVSEDLVARQVELLFSASRLGNRREVISQLHTLVPSFSFNQEAEAQTTPPKPNLRVL